MKYNQYTKDYMELNRCSEGSPLLRRKTLMKPRVNHLNQRPLQWRMELRCRKHYMLNYVFYTPHSRNLIRMSMNLTRENYQCIWHSSSLWRTVDGYQFAERQTCVSRVIEIHSVSAVMWITLLYRRHNLVQKIDYGVIKQNTLQEKYLYYFKTSAFTHITP